MKTFPRVCNILQVGDNSAGAQPCYNEGRKPSTDHVSFGSMNMEQGIQLRLGGSPLGWLFMHAWIPRNICKGENSDSSALGMDTEGILSPLRSTENMH